MTPPHRSRRRSRPTKGDLLDGLVDALRGFDAAENRLDVRSKVLSLADILKASRDYFTAVVRESSCDADDARDRIRLYLIQNVGVVVDATELEVVSGISEYGRRVRELRVEAGYRILTGASNDPDSGIILSPRQYLLLDPNPDEGAARRWNLANVIRRKNLSAKNRILEFLMANVDQVVTSEELAYVAGSAKEFGRRTRELRTEEGYAVATRFTGRPDLKSGEYVLESAVRVAEPHDRRIPEPVQKTVYSRDENTCVLCGWNRSLFTRMNPKFLELHHIQEHASGGSNDERNLVVLCNLCHDEVHAGNQDVMTRLRLIHNL